MSQRLSDPRFQGPLPPSTQTYRTVAVKGRCQGPQRELDHVPPCETPLLSLPRGWGWTRHPEISKQEFHHSRNKKRPVFKKITKARVSTGDTRTGVSTTHEVTLGPAAFVVDRGATSGSSPPKRADSIEKSWTDDRPHAAIHHHQESHGGIENPLVGTMMGVLQQGLAMSPFRWSPVLASSQWAVHGLNPSFHGPAHLVGSPGESNQHQKARSCTKKSPPYPRGEQRFHSKRKQINANLIHAFHRERERERGAEAMTQLTDHSRGWTNRLIHRCHTTS